ncbi:MAG: aspartate aminotransferase family protein [Phycisphaerales bacterium]|nr:aspartate aminotransferase family protein [Phycisphaerales bacterium]
MPETITPLTCSGPETLLELKRRYLIPCVYHFYKDPPQFVSGQGCTLTDHLGREYLDCYSGVTVMSAGHANPDIIEPAIEQLRTLQHTTTIYLTEPILRLAEQIAAITPGDLRRSFFCASGTEAVEGALLLAALHTGRTEIVAFTGALHGRTRWALNATGLDMWRTDPHPLPGVHRVPFGDLAALRTLLDSRGDHIAAVIGETIQGNGGINQPSDDFWPGVRELCDRSGALMILDEIQCGFNRTGRWFACQHWDVTPDVLVMSKALGNGFPIAAFTTTDHVAQSWTRPGASTYGGNPVCATAALAAIQFHQHHDLAAQAEQRGRQLRAGLAHARAILPHTGDIRGLGLMLGLPILDATGEPDAATCDRLLEALLARAVLAGKTGPGRNVLTFMPPLVISEAEVERVCHALVDAAREVAAA